MESVAHAISDMLTLPWLSTQVLLPYIDLVGITSQRSWSMYLLLRFTGVEFIRYWLTLNRDEIQFKYIEKCQKSLNNDDRNTTRHTVNKVLHIVAAHLEPLLAQGLSQFLQILWFDISGVHSTL